MLHFEGGTTPAPQTTSRPKIEAPFWGPDCDPLVPEHCGFPFPSNTALFDDPTTVTKKRVQFMRVTFDAPKTSKPFTKLRGSNFFAVLPTAGETMETWWFRTCIALADLGEYTRTRCVARLHWLFMDRRQRRIGSPSRAAKQRRPTTPGCSWWTTPSGSRR